MKNEEKPGKLEKRDTTFTQKTSQLKNANRQRDKKPADFKM
jgi:hypothetical protein